MLNLSDREQLIDYLKLHNLWLDKKSGQHFLVDGKVLDTIIAAADLEGAETVVEIGPGAGTLTQALAGAIPNGLVLALERDMRLVESLRQLFGSQKHVKVIHADILAYDLREIAGPYRLVANLPYQITGAILRKFLTFGGTAPEMLVIMLQREVADRLLAEPGHSERGILTLLVELFGTVERIIDVPPQAFFPAPEVNSTVVKIVRRPVETGGFEPETILSFARAGFAAKRRTLANALHGSLRLPKDRVGEILKKAEIPPLHRAEDLGLADWVRLAGELKTEVV